ncbi:ClpP/crotonase [Punctularia strigosozonata HHB-11173 SS5]|uniref:ClpP/crotonase n=1 Tax=Punctularia strigosozonata (strain HHB-11173) TaxID=741275 RepID=UPI0004417BDE|nr:ClpP/crotonase [Punctularia strigosozonata HHB-11173 SS5]EIN07424.1 ClpP/crotonase [Punctularia strigosozonata HHB-11173 SS5]
MSTIRVDVQDRIATITLNRPASLNAITRDDYDAFAVALRDIDQRQDVLVTVWQGRWFCAGTDVKVGGGTPASLRDTFLSRVSPVNTDVGRALYTHSKILVAAVQGPVMAFLGHFDFIYCTPQMWLSVPFAFLGLVTEGGSSASFINRMGVAQANEVLLWGKKKTAEELLASGFVNKIFQEQDVASFHAAVRAHLASELAGLDPTALLTIKQLLRRALEDKNDPDAVNLRESYGQAARLASGVPSVRFAQVAKKEIRHKL